MNEYVESDKPAAVDIRFLSGHDDYQQSSDPNPFSLSAEHQRSFFKPEQALDGQLAIY